LFLKENRTEKSLIEIRRSQDRDLPTIRALFREYASELRLDLSFQGFDEELDCLPGKYAPPGGELLLALNGKFPAGCVALRSLEPGFCEMKRLYVRQCYRGKGTGRELVKAIISAARKSGYSIMRLDTLSSMLSARSLYRAFGFKLITPYYHNPLEGAEYMQLDLRHPDR
jgi:ribosomal protein S18 acetylase RimI-like enzyme